MSIKCKNIDIHNPRNKTTLNLQDHISKNTSKEGIKNIFGQGNIRVVHLS